MSGRVALATFNPTFPGGVRVVTKKEIVKAISEQTGLTQLETKRIVQMTFDAIVETLVTSKERRIELRNFGVFEVKRRAARKARNPRTGDKVDVPEKYVVTFKPGKEMEERVRILEGSEDPGNDGENMIPSDSFMPADEPRSTPPPSNNGHSSGMGGA